MVDEVLPGSMSASVEIAMSFLLNPPSGRVESEGEQEVIDLLELGTEVVDLIDHVLDASDPVLTESLLDDLIFNQRNSLSVELSEAPLVDQGLDGALGGEAVGDIWLDLSEHVHGGLIVLNKNCVADFVQSEKGQDLPLFGGDLGQSLDSDDQEEGALLLNEKLVVEESLFLLLDQLRLLFLKSLGVFLALDQSVLLQLLGFLDLQRLGLGGLFGHLGDLRSLLKNAARNISSLYHLVYKNEFINY